MVIIVFLRNFEIGQAIEAISSAKWYLILASAAVYYLSLPLRASRWGLLLRPSGHDIAVEPLAHYYFLSWFINALLPARIGDIYRAYLLKKNNGVPVSLSFGVLFSERVFDLAVVSIFVVFSGAYFYTILRGTSEGDYLVFGFMAVIMILVFFVAMAIGLPRIQGFFPEKWSIRLELFRSGLFRSPSRLPIMIIMTSIIWLTEALRLYLVFLAFGIQAGFLMAVFISQASLILMAVPLSPAGLGLVELLMLKILSSTGILTDLAGALTIVDRIISYWSLLIFGGICYLLSARVR